MTFLRLGWIVLCSLLLIACGDERLSVATVAVRGVTVKLSAVNAEAPGNVSKITDKAEEIFRRRIETAIGAKSELAALNANRGPMEASGELMVLLQLVKSYRAETGESWNPFLKEVRERWRERDEDSPPDEAEIAKITANAMRTEIELLDDGRVALSGNGKLDIDRLAIGWAVDGAAEAMIGSGVKSGRVTAGGLHRIWGQRRKNKSWEIVVHAPGQDTTRYVLKPDEGGMCVLDPLRIDGGGSGDYPMILNPGTGSMASGALGTAVWTSSASASAVFAEALFVMGRRQAFEWVEERTDVALLYFYPDALGYAAEADPNMSNWLNLSVP